MFLLCSFSQIARSVSRVLHLGSKFVFFLVRYSARASTSLFRSILDFSIFWECFLTSLVKSFTSHFAKQNMTAYKFYHLDFLNHSYLSNPTSQTSPHRKNKK